MSALTNSFMAEKPRSESTKREKILMSKTAKINSAEAATQAYELLLAEETLILDAQIAIQRVLNEKGISQAELARKLGRGESYVSQLLGDSARNLTLRTIARIMHTLEEIPLVTTRRYAKGFEEPARPYECDADFSAWGEIIDLEPEGTISAQPWLASDWAANENHHSPAELAQAA